MEKKKLGILLGLVLLIFCMSFIVALEVPNYYDRYVNDYAGYLDSEDTTYLRALFYELEQNTTAQVVLVIVPNVSGSDIFSYSMAIAEKWKVGQADKDNGLIILYAVAENKIQVLTGYGLEGILPDSKIGRILDETYVPLRDFNQTREGIVKTSEALVLVIDENKEEVLSRKAGGSENSAGWIIFGIIIFFIVMFIIFSSSKKDKKKKQGKARKFWEILSFVGMIIISIVSNNPVLIIIAVLVWLALRMRSGNNNYFFGVPMRNSNSGFSGGGGFGGGSFGGGGFGGGGAGR